MSDAVSWTVDCSIKSGQLNNFKALVEEMVQWTHADPNTTAYEWYLNGDNTNCLIYERYASSNAALTHVRGFLENYAERFMSVADVSRLTVCGPADEELKGVMGVFGAGFMDHINGFTR